MRFLNAQPSTVVQDFLHKLYDLSIVQMLKMHFKRNNVLCHLSRVEFLGDLPLVAETKNRIHAIFTGTKWVMSFGWDTVILFGRTCCRW